MGEKEEMVVASGRIGGSEWGEVVGGRGGGV
jgi:hypothetical protein